VGDIGYTIGERHRGRGFATAAVRGVLEIAFAPDGVDLWRVEAVAAVENVASRRVLERAGLRYEGIARGYLVINGERVDHARYAVLRPE
jgi:ribosomal-protein-alanine N-acetyltransferase